MYTWCAWLPGEFNINIWGFFLCRSSIVYSTELYCPFCWFFLFCISLFSVDCKMFPLLLLFCFPLFLFFFHSYFCFRFCFFTLLFVCGFVLFFSLLSLICFGVCLFILLLFSFVYFLNSTLFGYIHHFI